ncbi:Hypothetical protein FKW44_011424 [Caligus rogercresseyi]|uniref:Uncharacterized protein n=1 Tax=Caligus rogercresseyi TaxID=217165 RepID=A0A7T8HI36_CALRO|nr:Hypothetical protein FKW44_011424 [Caligus rogercresseyi]
MMIQGVLLVLSNKPMASKTTNLLLEVLSELRWTPPFHLNSKSSIFVFFYPTDRYLKTAEGCSAIHSRKIVSLRVSGPHLSHSSLRQARDRVSSGQSIPSTRST